MSSAAFRMLMGAAALTPMMMQPAQAAVHRFHDDHVLGTSFDMAVVGADGLAATQAMLAARGAVDRLDLVLSGWRDDSELAALNRSSGAYAASPDLFDVIAACEAMRSSCGGAFSARLGTVEAVWNKAVMTGAEPDAGELARVAHQAETADVRLDPQARTIDRNGVAFTIDALAKGHIVDAALAAARRAAPQASGLMVDIGGDAAFHGAGPGGQPWRVGVAGGGAAENALPSSILALNGGAVATSRSGARDRLIGGKAYSHLLAPGSGTVAPARLVTVVAERTAEADALATAFAVLPAPQALAMAQSLPDVATRIVDGDGAVHTSTSWATLVARSPGSAGHGAPLADCAAAWPAGFEVTIDYDIPQSQSFRARPPFVAIFITDSSGTMVRTLTHLGTRPARYLDSNYVWYRAFEAKFPNASLSTVTRPSRAAGQYSMVWDGKDDAGNPVGQGRYVINVEMSREHGGHSIQSIPLTLGATPVSGAAAAQTESGPAAAHYGKAQ